MKCLVADSFEKEGLETLARLGLEVVDDASLKGAPLTAAIASSDPDILLVRGTRVTREMIESGPSLGLIVRAGAGYNTIDVTTASARGVFVANCPGKNSAAVAELAFGLILALDRRIADGVVDLRAGKWNKREYSKAHGIKGRTLGIVGLGGIGRAMVRRAAGFEMRVVAWSRSLTDERAAELGVKRLASVTEVVQCACRRVPPKLINRLSHATPSDRAATAYDQASTGIAQLSLARRSAAPSGHEAIQLQSCDATLQDRAARSTASRNVIVRRRVETEPSGRSDARRDTGLQTTAARPRIVPSWMAPVLPEESEGGR